MSTEPDAEDRALARNIKRAWKTVQDPERGLAFAVATYRVLRAKASAKAAVAAERERVLLAVFTLDRHGSTNVVTGEKYWAYREGDVADLAAKLRGGT